MENQVVSLTRSFSHKLVPENYGINGHKFAPMDFFASYGDTLVKEEATPEKIKELSDKLHQMAKDAVESSVAEYVAMLRGDSETPTQLNADELAPIADIIAEANEANTKTKLTAVKAKATERKTQLTAIQLQFLASLFRKIENKL